VHPGHSKRAWCNTLDPWKLHWQFREFLPTHKLPGAGVPKLWTPLEVIRSVFDKLDHFLKIIKSYTKSHKKITTKKDNANDAKV
jgi:hypothetical protein